MWTSDANNMDNNVSENKMMEDKMVDNNVTEKQEKTTSPFREVLPQVSLIWIIRWFVLLDNGADC